MRKIVDFVEHLECPTIDGFIFEDERVQLLGIEINWKEPIIYNVKLGAKTSIEDISSNNAPCNSCAILVNSIHESHSVEVIAGEGNYGSDGFVAVISLKSRKTIWIGFSQTQTHLIK